MCIAKSNPQREEAASVFLKWFTENKQNINFAMSSGYLPVKSSAYKSDTFKQALAKLEQGSKNKQNVSMVYDIALEQVDKRNTYAAKPFEGSYKIRFILQQSLMESAEDAKQFAAPLKTKNLTEKEIYSQLTMDKRFDTWIQTLQKQLSSEGIAYQIYASK